MAGDVRPDKNDAEVAKLLVERKIVTPEQLEEAARDRQTLILGGAPAPRLGEVLVKKGFVPSVEVLESLRAESGVITRCKACRAHFKVLFYKAGSAYACERCGGALEKVEAPLASGSRVGPAIISSVLAAPSPPEVAEAARDPANLFGKYVLVRELGRGGGGIVHKAWDSYLSRYVALKFIRTQEAGDAPPGASSNEVQDLLKEARLAARLRHPNIVSIHEVAFLDNKYYISMDFIGGGTLTERIRGSAKAGTTRFAEDPQGFVRILRDVARAADHAHRQDPPLIHRDLKPQNILLDAAGQPFIADFGLAQELSAGDRSSGQVVGTPSYMAPEQAAGRTEEVDARTDVYALGAILYEVLCGRPPFTGKNVPEILLKIVREKVQPPGQRIGAAVPEALEKTCLKALSKDRAERHANAGDFADELDRFLKPSRGPLRSVVLVILLLAAAAGAFFAFRPAPPPPRPGDRGEELAALASKHLEARDWTALKGALAEMKEVAPDHPRAGELGKALEEHEALLARSRKEWDAGVERLKTDPLEKVLEALRPQFRRTPELRADFAENLKWALTALQPAFQEEARQVAGAGPGDRWLQEEVKRQAKNLRDRIEVLLGMGQDKDFPFKADARLAETRDALDRVIAYLGTWDLRVNAAPFAEVMILRGGKVVAREFTPWGLRGVEIAPEGFQAVLSWPSEADPKVRLTRDIKDLRHGQTITIRGDMASSVIQLDRR